jgi:hypothetical protein
MRLEKISQELRNLQSLKSRLNKQKNRPDFDSKMNDILSEINLLQQERKALQPPKKFVTNFTQEDVNNLGYDEVVRAIKSIQSKICLTQHSDDQTEYQAAKEIEQKLIDRRAEIKPTDRRVVPVSKLLALRELVEEDSTRINQEWLLQKLAEIID